jgi:TolB-like protein/DNA-binding winged helix-turn-helix (wHTH) protein/Flp pilus assembly protein TadD
LTDDDLDLQMNAPADLRTDQPLEQGFQLGELRIDPNAGEVSGPGGREKLDPKVMDVLVMLAQHAGQVVLREELLARIWPNAVVTDDALSRCIYELRRQLSQAGGDEQFKAMLETVPKRGYRLNGEVTPLPRPSTTAPASRRKLYLLAMPAAIVVAAALWFTLGQRASGPPAEPSPPTADARPASIAILPFVDMSSGQNEEHFSDGVSEEILNRLNQTRTLRVIARTSSFSFRDQSISIPEIAAKLDVTHVLEGSVRRSGDRVRITARLVEASSNSQLWSATYDRERGDLFAVQDELATSVASALRTRLEGTAPGGPMSEEAHDLFLQGEFFYNRRAPGDVARSVKYYQQALAIEPGYARLWAALAGAYSLLAYSGEMPREVALAKQGEAARKAVALDPGLAVGHARLSQYHWDIGDRRTGYEIWDTARALDPDDPLILNFTAGLAMRAGDVDVGIETQRRLVARDPLSASYHANLGTYLLARDQFEEAKSELQKAQELNPDFGWEVDLAIARILILERRFDDARSLIEDLPEGESRDHGFALLYHALGRGKEADAAVKRLAAQSTSSPDIRLAEVHAFQGSIDAAFEALQGLQVAIVRNEAALASQIWSWQLEMRVSPFLKPLHADPRWSPLLVEPPSPATASPG